MLDAALRTFAAMVHRTWLVTMVAVVACATFAARALDALEADPVAVPTTPPHTVPDAPPSVRATPDGSAFVARNMFCSSCSPGTGATAPGARPFGGRAAVLIAIQLGGAPRATLRVLETEVQGSWGLHERIPGVGIVDRIGPASIDVVDSTGQRATLTLRGDAAAIGDGGAATPPPVAAAGPFADRIRPLSDHAFEVDRDLVRELVSGTTKTGGVRMLPMVKDGAVLGVRVLGVTARSIPAAIGLRSGDQLTAIDGTPIKSAQQLLDLYARLDQITAVELQGTRAGKPLAITLQLR